MKLKVTKGELIISKHVEMADQYLLGGARGAPPPHWLGLSKIQIDYRQKKCLLWNIIIETFRDVSELQESRYLAIAQKRYSARHLTENSCTNYAMRFAR